MAFVNLFSCSGTRSAINSRLTVSRELFRQVLRLETKEVMVQKPAQYLPRLLFVLTPNPQQSSQRGDRLCRRWLIASRDELLLKLMMMWQKKDFSVPVARHTWCTCFASFLFLFSLFVINVASCTPILLISPSLCIHPLYL